MPVRELIGAEWKLLGSAKVSIATVTTTYFDFGTPDNINLSTTTASAPGLLYRPGDRVVAIVDMSTAGTTDTTAISVLDAPDSSGSIGTTAAAVTSGTLTGGTGDQYALIGIKVQAGRPWIKIGVVRASGTTDTTCAVPGVRDPAGALTSWR
jgi:hypothetical protein